MVNLKQKLNNLKGTILGLRMETNLLEQDLNRIEVDLFYLDKMHRDLVYNINLLRRDDIVSVLSEYNKSLSALDEVCRQINKFKKLRQNLQKTLDNNLKQCEYYYNELQKEIDSIGKVLPFKRSVNESQG